MTEVSLSAARHLTPPTDPNHPLRQVATELEAAFLAEMLKHARLGEVDTQFSGGAGEDQFASLLRMEHARALAEHGGLGLAEAVFQSLVTRSSGSGGG